MELLSADLRIFCKLYLYCWFLPTGVTFDHSLIGATSGTEGSGKDFAACGVFLKRTSPKKFRQSCRDTTGETNEKSDDFG